MRAGHFIVFSVLCLIAAACSEAKPPQHKAVAHYLANEGVMIVSGETKVVFDPLFDKTFGQYQQMPEDMRAAFMDGEPPYDGIDAVLISHYHDDHFAPSEMLAYLIAHQDVHLYAPSAAVEELVALITEDEQREAILQRTTTVALAYGDAPLSFTLGEIFVEAVRIPHAGWPTQRTEVENIAWRVTLNDHTTVLHMGDADPRDEHFAKHPDHWAAQETDMAFPPYWFFLSMQGNAILRDRVGADQNVGIHVPERMPDVPEDRPAEYRGYDLFTEPGERRGIRVVED